MIKCDLEMKRKLFIVVALFCFAFPFLAVGQSADLSDEVQVRDSVVYVPAARLDSAYFGKNVFYILPSKANGNHADVRVFQSQLILNSMKTHIASNSSRSIDGYRIRIFFDNRQSSRTESENVEKRFAASYPGIPVYRSYVNPYFKVTVGDFRTRSEAMEFLLTIKNEFPASFIVKEGINYPVVDKTHAFETDTIKVSVPVRPID